MAAASTTTVDCWVADVELVDPERFIGTLPAKFGALCDSPCGASVLGAAAVATGVSGVAASRATGDARADATARGLAGAAMATAAGIPVWVGVAPADVVVSLLDGVELVCAPPELFLIPERGSAVEASLAEEVELAWASTELCTTPDVEPDEEAAAEADESVDDVGSVDDVLAADSDDGLEADDDESDDEREELVSVGSANATPGVVATAPPTPSANANTPARIMCCAVTGIALRGQSARAPARWDPAAVKVILATFLVDAVGLRCRLLMARWCPLCTRPRGQLSGSGWRGCPAGRLFPGGNVAGFTPRGRKRLQGPIRWTGWVPRLHPRCSSVSPPNGWSSARKGGGGPPL